MQNSTTLYFGYGSNLWLHQMHQRCPSAQYIGLARLSGYKWIISQRGYANVVQVSVTSTDHITTTTTTTNTSDGKQDGGEDEEAVYGMIYTLTPTDEAALDKNEGVPLAYTKEYLHCNVWIHSTGPVDPQYPHLIRKIDTTEEPTEHRDLLVYIDRVRVSEGAPRKEYVVRMNRGITDATKCGVPAGYVEDVLRKFVPEEEGGKGEEVQELAERQARGFKDESGVF
jgi:gamma-glutamylcyclotransferase